MSNDVTRYSDTDLEMFKDVIDKKLALARENLHDLQSQMNDLAENSFDDFGGDYMDDSETNTEMEYLNNMIIRQKKYIQDLENALIRITNKTYGICVVTGKLIDKKRLMAVPHATKSMEAKMSQPSSSTSSSSASNYAQRSEFNESSSMSEEDMD
ncbi:MAG: TraR/DksA family transcriptional regulator [Saprospiraceae bacterium]